MVSTGREQRPGTVRFQRPFSGPCQVLSDSRLAQDVEASFLNDDDEEQEEVEEKDPASKTHT